MNDRACVYRRQYGIPDEWGTACNVMAMVFGNLGDDCATGVALTRDGSLGTTAARYERSGIRRSKGGSWQTAAGS
jgi:phosphoenolpyruvate synthase/pyruvate phosphate dikinase